MQYIPDVKILCGEGMHFGTGHSERMIVLKSLLDRHFLKTELHFTEKLNTIPEEFLSYDKALIQPLLILDIRDADLNSIQNRPAVILDNRCRNRRQYEKVPGIYFFDSLPYPGCNLNKVFQSLLIDPKLIELKKTKTLNQKKERKKILLYADDLFPEWLGSALSKLANGRFSISAAGSSRIIPQFPEIENLGRMDRQSFYNVLLESDIVFSYFGMLYFESLYLHKTAVLYTRGTERSEHGILSEYFSCEMGVPYLKSIQDFLDFDFNIQPQSPKIKISGYGYKALQDLILMIRKDTVRS